MRDSIIDFYMSPILEEQLDNAREAVEKRDRDFVIAIDGEEGSDKSVLAQQVAKKLDPDFNIENIVFNADQFIERIKKAKKNSCILLDEAFSASSSRGALTEINRSMVAVATEMRQRNLYVLIVLPTFFDLDKYFALWRCRALFHVYFNKNGGRGSFIIFPKSAKKYLYLNGKKHYNYSKPASPFPACSFPNKYTVDETEYRQKKAEAFNKRTVSNQAKKWKLQRDSLVNECYHNRDVASREFEKIFTKWGAVPISQREIQKIAGLMNISERVIEEDNDELEEGVVGPGPAILD